jgi:hypothetical protein
MSFDINVIWLLNRYLLNDRNMENKKRAQRDHVTDSVVKLPSSVNDPLEIEVISLLYRYLLVTLEWSTNTWCNKTASNKQFGQVAKSIEGAVRKRCDFVVIQIPGEDIRIIQTHCVMSPTIKQCGQAAKFSKGSARNRCDLVAWYVSIHDTRMKHKCKAKCCVSKQLTGRSSGQVWRWCRWESM